MYTKSSLPTSNIRHLIHCFVFEPCILQAALSCPALKDNEPISNISRTCSISTFPMESTVLFLSVFPLRYDNTKYSLACY